MHNHYFLAFDVGGIFIKAAVVNEQGEVVPDTISFYPSKAHSDREEILKHLTQLICLQTGEIMDKYFTIDGLGFAFPGPFDYLNGISRISGVNKFESLFGSNLHKELTEFFAKLPKEVYESAVMDRSFSCRVKRRRRFR